MRQIYIEITDFCGLNCHFCPSAKRVKNVMSLDDFEHILTQVRPHTNKLLLHLLGDPFTVLNLMDFLELTCRYDFRIELTTSGFHLDNQSFEIFEYITQLNISLNSASALSQTRLEEYLKKIYVWCEHKVCHYPKPFINLRLWNQKGDKKDDLFTKKILNWAYNHFGTKSDRLASKVKLNFDEYFEWPSLKGEVMTNGFCHGAKEQIGILNNGRVVPCCLDCDGVVELGNIFHQPFEEILNSQRVRDIVDGFSKKMAVEELCKKCTFKQRFEMKR